MEISLYKYVFIYALVLSRYKIMYIPLLLHCNHCMQLTSEDRVYNIELLEYAYEKYAVENHREISPRSLPRENSSCFQPQFNISFNEVQEVRQKAHSRIYARARIESSRSKQVDLLTVFATQSTFYDRPVLRITIIMNYLRVHDFVDPFTSEICF